MKKFIIFLIIFFTKCFNLTTKIVQVLIKYGVNVYRKQENWENRSNVIYYSDLICECSILALTLIHYFHILYLLGMSFSLTAILLLHIKEAFSNLKKKLTSFANYQQLKRDIKSKFPSVSAEELLQLNDDCAICRDSMQTAKKLPCSHVFHEYCLRLWLENHQSCPTCRYSLLQNPQPPQGANAPRRRWFFIPRFNWFRRRGFVITAEMIEHVREFVPHTRNVPDHIIREQLERTKSINETINYFVDRSPAENEPVQPPVPVNDLPVVPQPLNQPFPQQSAERVLSPALSKEDLSGFAASQVEREKILAERKLKLKEKARRFAFFLFLFIRELNLNFCREFLARKMGDKHPSRNQEVIEELKQEEPEEEIFIPTAVEEATEPIEQVIVEHLVESKVTSNSEGGLPFSKNDSVEIKRRRLLEAAERRLKQKELTELDNQ